ncbi:MAG TPA: sugar ABC transporter permease [Clostridiales bacterium]|nr:sugar ABC transporter permease [Clostridiales bacterium]
MKKLTITQRKKVNGYLFISPWLVGLILFFLHPFIQSLRLSLSKITKFAGFHMKWVGLENYARAFLWDVDFLPMFGTVVKDTFINTIMIVVFSLMIAILVNKKIKFRGFFRGAFFLPVLLGTGYVMEQLLGINAEGPAMEMARGITIPEEFMRYLDPVVVSVLSGFLNRITYVLWKSGVQIILFLAGLQGISSSLYEAARVDSATEWEMFWKITLPMISPVILLNVIYTIIDSFTDTSNPIVDYVLDIGFTKSQFEYSAAISWIYFIFVLFVCGIVYFVMRNKVYDTSRK